MRSLGLDGGWCRGNAPSLARTERTATPRAVHDRVSEKNRCGFSDIRHLGLDHAGRSLSTPTAAPRPPCSDCWRGGSGRSGQAAGRGAGPLALQDQLQLCRLGLLCASGHWSLREMPRRSSPAPASEQCEMPRVLPLVYTCTEEGWSSPAQGRLYWFLHVRSSTASDDTSSYDLI